jgi:hypothetical protein
MDSPSAPMVKEVLVTYSQGRATPDAVMRALIGYGVRLVPAVWMMAWCRSAGPSDASRGYAARRSTLSWRPAVIRP